ncbi:uncharacterized protein G2W53_006788 [Senna tora]|uniref:Uncharacterized protein n=1 Tax=Senna tora TaxID=362788 RepID=A0A835CEC5_9FABA|nr:uncharacterized protein G2W53_006788 [Senna tora]
MDQKLRRLKKMIEKKLLEGDPHVLKATGLEWRISDRRGRKGRVENTAEGSSTT